MKPRMTPRKEQEWIKGVIYGVVLVAIILVGIPTLKIWDAHRMIGMYEAGKQVGYQTCLNRPIREQMITIQTQLGLKKLDGKIGPETKPAVNNRVDEEEKDLCNQHATECIKEALEGETK